MASPERLSLVLLLLSLLVAACAPQPISPAGDGPCLDGGRRCAAAAAGAADRRAPASTLRQERVYPCRNRESGQADICFDTDLGQRNHGQLGPRF